MIFHAVFLGFLLAVNANHCQYSCKYLADGLYQKCGTCIKYLQCGNQITYVQPCPENLKWDNVVKNCIGTSNTCVSDEHYPEKKTSGSVGSCGANFCEGKTGYFPHCSSCSKFIQCANNQEFEQDCPGNLYWNPDITGCDYSYNVDCE